MFDITTPATVVPATVVTDIEVAWTLAQAEQAEREAASQRPVWSQAEERQFQSQRESQARALAAMRRRETELTHDNARLARLAADLQQPIEVGDPRLLHIWVTAARTANEQQHCSEYDRIARSIGIPTRDELREQGHLTSTYEVSVAVTMSTVVMVTVEASDGDEAMRQVDSYNRRDIWDSLDVDSLDADNLDNWDANDAEEV